MKTITLKNLAESTRQEVFDFIATHLLKQNEKAQTQNESCKYKIGKLRCAAGCLFGPYEYKQRYEDVTWGSLALDGYVPAEHSSLISRLQRVHDGAAVSAWRNALKVSARDFKLNQKAIRAVE